MSELPESVRRALSDLAADDVAADGVAADGVAPEELADTPDDHPDAVDLAELLDGVLPDAARARVEAHLAHCTTCRALLAESAAATAAVESIDTANLPETVDLPEAVGLPASPPIERRRPARWLALAALLVLALGATAYWVARGDARDRRALARVGVDTESFPDADRAWIRRAARATRGTWPRPDEAVGFGDIAAAETLRSGDALDGPLPLAPRWQAVDGLEPVLHWTMPASPSRSATGPARFEILVVDPDERAVAFVEGSLHESLDAVHEIRLDNTSVALEPGASYAWKVNVAIDGDWRSSAYVPFRVLDEDEAEQLRSALMSAGDNAFLRAVVWSAFGVDDRAVAALEKAPLETEQRAAFQRSLLRRARLEPNEVAIAIDRAHQP